MKTFPLSFLILFATLFIKLSDSAAQDYIPIFSRDYSTRLSLEIDPITFLYKGYSLHIRYQPMFSERLLIGLGTYALDVPDPVVDLNRRNRDIGWDVRIRSAYFLYGEFFLEKANHGWFVGEQIGFQSFKISNDSEVTGSASFNNALLLTYLGYSWHPYKGSFYIKPWAGVGFTHKVDGLNNVGPLHYNISPLFVSAALHVGYTF
jgi:hypothetical protein